MQTSLAVACTQYTRPYVHLLLRGYRTTPFQLRNRFRTAASTLPDALACSRLETYPEFPAEGGCDWTLTGGRAE